MVRYEFSLEIVRICLPNNTLLPALIFNLYSFWHFQKIKISLKTPIHYKDFSRLFAPKVWNLQGYLLTLVNRCCKSRNRLNRNILYLRFNWANSTLTERLEDFQMYSYEKDLRRKFLKWSYCFIKRRSKPLNDRSPAASSSVHLFTSRG